MVTAEDTKIPKDSSWTLELTPTNLPGTYLHDTKQNMATQKNYSLTSTGDGNVIVIDKNGENEVAEKQIGLGMSDQEPSIDVNDNDF